MAAEEEADELVAAAPDETTLESWVRRREVGEPLAWITGWAPFCGARVGVDPGVYVPRPQSEELAHRAAECLAAGGRAADLCTGSGALAHHLLAAVPGAVVVGTDLSARAARCARANGVPVVVGDLDAGLARGAFDVVTAVAPYVPTGQIPFLPADVQRYEPRRALDGGDDGLGVLRRLVGAAAGLLRPGGWLLVELGGDQDRMFGLLVEGAGFGPAETWCDGEGDLRGAVARLR